MDESVEVLRLTFLPLLMYGLFIVGPILSIWKAFSLAEEKPSHQWWMRLYAAGCFLRPVPGEPYLFDKMAWIGTSQESKGFDPFFFLVLYPLAYFGIALGLLTNPWLWYPVSVAGSMFAFGLVTRLSVLKFRSAIKSHNEDKEAHSNMRNR